MNKYPKVNISTIESANGTRYIITDVATGIIIDDAQGYGFKTQETSLRYAISKGWVVMNPPYVPKTNPLF